MSEAELRNPCSPSGNTSPTSTQRVAKWRERKRRGVLFLVGLEVVDRDLRLLKKGGYLASDDPKTVGKAEVEDALGAMLDAAVKRFGVFAARSDAPTKDSV